MEGSFECDDDDGRQNADPRMLLTKFSRGWCCEEEEAADADAVREDDDDEDDDCIVWER
jgi:hypothetical protein